MTQNQIITVAARKKMLRARAGEIQLPKIMGFVFGDGGVNASGEVISPLESESKLKHEILRKAYDKYTILMIRPADTNVRLQKTSFLMPRLVRLVYMTRMEIFL